MHWVAQACLVMLSSFCCQDKRREKLFFFHPIQVLTSVNPLFSLVCHSDLNHRCRKIYRHYIRYLGIFYEFFGFQDYTFYCLLWRPCLWLTLLTIIPVLCFKHYSELFIFDFRIHSVFLLLIWMHYLMLTLR